MVNYHTIRIWMYKLYIQVQREFYIIARIAFSLRKKREEKLVYYKENGTKKLIFLRNKFPRTYARLKNWNFENKIINN